MRHGAATFACVHASGDAGYVTGGPLGSGALGFALAAILVVGVGICDDKFDLPWHVRIAAQVLAALIMVYVGGIRIDNLGSMFGVDIPSLGLLSVPFTVFATVGAINAVNMVDGSDGLAGLLVLATLMMVFAAALYSGDGAITRHAPILIGAVAGFLAYNLRFPGRPRALVFMGNAGSAFLGLMIAWCACRLTQNPAHPVDPVLAIWMVPVPIIDCLILMTRRLRHRHSPFCADRNHVHHLMLDSGFGPMQVALLLVGFSFLAGLASALALRAHLPHVWLLAAFAAIGVAWYWATARRARALAMFSHLHTLLRGGQRPAAQRGTARARQA